MFTEGYINIHRKILNWEWYNDLNVYRLFMHLLLTVNWTSSIWHGTEIKPGQIITSVEHLSTETGLSKQQIRTALNKLQKTGEITIQTTNKYTFITVENYDMYQNSQEKNNIKADSEKDRSNKQITNKIQRK